MGTRKGIERKDKKPILAPGDSARYLRHSLLISDWEPIDIADITQVENRINQYFALCVQDDLKPTFGDLALALGVATQTLRNWMHGDLRGSAHMVTIKKARQIIASQMEHYMMEGKINPMAGVFLMVNNFDYRNTNAVEINVAQPDPLRDNLPEPDNIVARYEELPEI